MTQQTAVMDVRSWDQGSGHMNPPSADSLAIMQAAQGSADGALSQASIGQIGGPGDAAWQRYGNGAVIHVVGLDLSGEPGQSRERVTALLARVYSKVLAAFVATGCDTLRMVPLASGRCAGDWADGTDDLMRNALRHAVASMEPQAEIVQGRLEYCREINTNAAGGQLGADDGAAGDGPRRPWRQSDLNAVFPPYGITADMARWLDLQPGSPDRWPRCGDAQAIVQGGPRGVEHQACAVHTIFQLMEGFRGCLGTPGDVAAEVRRLARAGSQDLLSITDVWWCVTSRLPHDCGRPRLMLLSRGSDGRVDDRGATVVGSPGHWNGSMVAALGTGNHYVPVWWPTATGRTGLVPLWAREQARHRLAMAIDAGPAAAVIAALRWDVVAYYGHPDATERPDGGDAGTRRRWLGAMSDSVRASQGLRDIGSSCDVRVCHDPALAATDHECRPIHHMTTGVWASDTPADGYMILYDMMGVWWCRQPGLDAVPDRLPDGVPAAATGRGNS